MFTNLTILTLVSTVSFAGVPTGWQSFTPTQGGMKIMLPGQPGYQHSTVDTAAGKVDIHTYSYQDAETGMSFGVILSDFPAQSVANFTFEQKHEVLGGVQKGFLEGTKGKLLSEKKLRIGQHPGKDVFIQLPAAGKFMRARFFMVNERVYQIGVIGTQESVTGGEGEEFVKSFRLVGK